MTEEIWKDIQGYEGFYQVSNLGKIKSLDRIVIRKNNSRLPIKSRVLKPGYNDKGYEIVCLHKGQIKHTVTVHSIVAKTFLGKRAEGFDTDHKNRIKTDNRSENLRYVTRSVNSRNSNLSKRNTSGFKGVFWDKGTQKWKASISIGNKTKHIGVYKEITDAVNAYDKVAESLGYTTNKELGRL